jgi:hypothetical protein
MLFGLTNAPSPFQSLMNSLFNPPIKTFVLVFFGDILIYNKSWEEHIQHVDMALKLLEEQKLYFKAFQVFLWGFGSAIFGSYCISCGHQGGPQENYSYDGMVNFQNIEES